MGEGEADRDRLGLERHHGRGDALDLGRGQRRHHLAEGVHALGGLDRQRARHHGRRLPRGQRIEVGAHLVADQQQIAEALRHHQRRLGAGAGQEGVGADREAMDEEVDIAGRDAGLGREPLDALAHAQRRAGRLAGDLIDEDPGGRGIAVDQHQIGECSADIGCKVAHGGII